MKYTVYMLFLSNYLYVHCFFTDVLYFDSNVLMFLKRELLRNSTKNRTNKAETSVYVFEISVFRNLAGNHYL